MASRYNVTEVNYNGRNEIHPHRPVWFEATPKRGDLFSLDSGDGKPQIYEVIGTVQLASHEEATLSADLGTVYVAHLGNKASIESRFNLNQSVWSTRPELTVDH